MIEKLKDSDVKPELLAELMSIIDKINEIIDYLNEHQEDV